MTPPTDIAGTYEQHMQEAKHAAFTRWQRSGYRDLEAHAEFLRWYEAGVRYATRKRKLRDFN